MDLDFDPSFQCWSEFCIYVNTPIEHFKNWSPLAKINITSDLHSIGTIRVRGWSIHTNYLDNYVRVLRKKFCSKFCLFVYLLTKICATSRNFGPRKFLKKNFFLFSFLLWLLSKQIDDVLKNVDDIEWPAIDALRIG